MRPGRFLALGLAILVLGLIGMTVQINLGTVLVTLLGGAIVVQTMIGSK